MSVVPETDAAQKKSLNQYFKSLYPKNRIEKLFTLLAGKRWREQMAKRFTDHDP